MTLRVPFPFLPYFSYIFMDVYIFRVCEYKVFVFVWKLLYLFVFIFPTSLNTDHPWVQNAKKAPDVPLGETVKARLKQFAVMNKFKKKALRVRFEMYLDFECRPACLFVWLMTDATL